MLYRRFDDGMLGAFRTPIGQSLDMLLTEAVRSGRLGLANVPGNGLADDTATYAWVPAMIRFYLGEEPLLGSVPTWVLADDGQWAQVRDRLHELVVKPVAGYGGRGTVFGPACSAAELASLQAEVAAAPYRFVAQEPVRGQHRAHAGRRRPGAPAGGPAGVLGRRARGHRTGAARAADPRGARRGRGRAPDAAPRTPGCSADFSACGQSTVHRRAGR